MKLLLFTLTAAVITAMPLSHINQLVSFPAPQIDLQTNLDLFRLQAESPQSEVFYAGGIVGYFANAWDAPVWTVPYDWYADHENREAAAFVEWPAIELERPVLPSTETEGSPGTPTPVPTPVAPSSEVPEPGTWSLIGGGLIGLALLRRRR